MGKMLSLVHLLPHVSFSTSSCLLSVLQVQSLKEIRSKWLPKKNLMKNGNGLVNQYSVKMLFPKNVSSTLSPPSPAIRENSRRNELPNSTSTPCYPSASTIRRKRSSEEYQNNGRLLSLLLTKLHFLGGLSLTELLDRLV